MLIIIMSKDCGSPAIITPLSRFLSRYDSLSSVRCEYWTPGRIQFCIKTLSVVGRCFGGRCEGVVVSARRT